MIFHLIYFVLHFVTVLPNLIHMTGIEQAVAQQKE
jgi:hypothetical protein